MQLGMCVSRKTMKNRTRKSLSIINYMYILFLFIFDLVFSFLSCGFLFLV